MDSLFAMTWKCLTQASTCSAPWPLMAALPGAGGSSTASWRTSRSPVFHHQLHSAHSRLPLNLSTQCSEMPAESAQGDLPALGLTVSPGLAAATGAGKASRICLLSAAGLWQEKPFTHEGTRRRWVSSPRKRASAPCDAPNKTLMDQSAPASSWGAASSLIKNKKYLGR